MIQQSPRQSSSKLDSRLSQVQALIGWPSHADIGTDHAHLPLALLQSGRCQRVIGIELNAGPLQRARAATAHCPAIEIRQGDGFGPLARDEVDGASICGVGAATILKMLGQAQRLPEYLVLQPNTAAQPLRHWAATHGYHLQAERLVSGFWLYPVLALRRAAGPDPAYGPFVTDPPIALQAAQRFGPLLLRAHDTLLLAELQRQHRRLAALPSAAAYRELQVVRWALQQYSQRS